MQNSRNRGMRAGILVMSVFLGFFLYLSSLSLPTSKIEAAEEKKGDPAAGEKLFFDTQGLGALACVNCHKVNGKGADVGPDLSHVGQKPVEYLRESIVKPSAYIVPGYEILSIKLKDGKTIDGLKKGETDKELKIMDITDPDLKIQTIQKDQIESITPQPDSFMFSFEKILKEDQLNNIVAYLQTLK